MEYEVERAKRVFYEIKRKESFHQLFCENDLLSRFQPILRCVEKQQKSPYYTTVKRFEKSHFGRSNPVLDI